MKWIIRLLLVYVAVFSLQTIHISREPEREGKEDEAAVLGYDIISRGPVMKTERFLALRGLRHMKPQGTLIDVGCGPGYLVEDVRLAFPSIRVVGVDVNRDMLKQAVSNFGRLSQYCLADGTALPFHDGSLDLVVCTGAFHHLSEAAVALAEFHRVLKPGGRLLILELRRDIRRLYFWIVAAIQLTMPDGTRRVNGPVGSVWSSYTLPEMRGLLEQSPFFEWRIRPFPAWVYISGTRSPR